MMIVDLKGTVMYVTETIAQLVGPAVVRHNICDIFAGSNVIVNGMHFPSIHARLML